LGLGIESGGVLPPPVAVLPLKGVGGTEASGLHP